MRVAIENMLSMQFRMNSRVHEDWINQHHEWYRAIWIECGELMDHVGYKWWKKQESDMGQVRLELIDIWHFGLSALFDDKTDIAELAKRIELDLCCDVKLESKNIHVATEALALDCLRTKYFSVTLFAQLMAVCDLGFDDLYRHYIGKNILNFFRQDHGYKEGSYIKMWGGREDNEHLLDILGSIDCSSEHFPENVYSSLSQRYPNDG